MKVMLDTNLIFDVWLAREPFWPDSTRLLARVEGGEIEGWICPTTVTTLHYLARKVLGETKARLRIEELLSPCQVGHMSATTFTSALASDLSDFGDAVIEAVSVHAHIDYIAERNPKGFAQ